MPGRSLFSAARDPVSQRFGVLAGDGADGRESTLQRRVDELPGALLLTVFFQHFGQIIQRGDLAGLELVGAGEVVVGQFALGLDFLRIARPAGMLLHSHVQKAEVVKDGRVLVVVFTGFVVEGDGLGKIAGLVGFEDEEEAQRGVDQRGLVVRRRALDGGDGLVQLAQPPQADGVCLLYTSDAADE